ncbi:MAG: LacI family transcriptional regulator [Treponema sp.]|jgi:DNA-binding LacI/PurR family transcriptional regulator|nr:LacI family transcriptional regulator [Treponema sp.]
MTKTTIRQIAKELGISPATVSKAISGKPEVNEQTRARVLARVRELGYVSPNGSIRQGALRVAVLIKDYLRDNAEGGIPYRDHNIFHYDIIMGLKEYGEKKNMEIIMLTTTDEAQANSSYDDFMQSKNIDGAFIYGLRTQDPYFLQLKDTAIPTVILEHSVNNPQVGRVGIDNVAGAELAVEHLISLGHRSIGLLNGHPQTHAARERFAGYAAALSRYDIPFRRELVLEGDSTIQRGQEGADYFTNMKITALFCASDFLAMGAIKGFRDKGIRIPGNISIVGFDNLPFTNLYSPRLTTVAQDRRQIGLCAGALLLLIMEGEPIRHCVLTPFLIERETTTALL